MDNRNIQQDDILIVFEVEVLEDHNDFIFDKLI